MEALLLITVNTGRVIARQMILDTCVARGAKRRPQGDDLFNGQPRGQTPLGDVPADNLRKSVFLASENGAPLCQGNLLMMHGYDKN